ncbi:transcription termination/antitermination protein NusA [Mycoplasmopsis columbinasalis]|uniref:N utilization substance protein A n=1 Tax=Mycoplasmopsis columbinasalis TaxID=114880 RepID=A0A449BAV6_9BACT|nr:transcription termination/antitermination protein NusA [Mycoplasmopsis columbinasalis]VEU78324.1 N utilization substance protein A [Mycoplasmopsis columbinasalis]
MKKEKTPEQIEREYSKKMYGAIKAYSDSMKLPLEQMVELFSEEITNIINKKIDPEANIVLEIDPKKEQILTYNTNTLVVEDEAFDPEDYAQAIYNVPLSKALKVDKKAQVDDEIKVRVNLSLLSESPSPEVKQVLKIVQQSLIQRIKTFQKTLLFNTYSQKIGQKIYVEFTSKNKDGSWNVKICQDGATVYLPASMISAKRKVQPGYKCDVIIEEVDEFSKLSQIKVSLDSPAMVRTELIENIPELNQGLIEIVGVFRRPGERTKVAVKKADATTVDFDLYGALIGPGGQRINNISKKLDGEKLDIVQWSPEIKTYVANAMSPSNVVDVIAKNPNDDNPRQFYVIVPNQDLTPAIGKKGINVLLASSLTRTQLDVLSVQQAEEKGLVFDHSKLEQLTQSGARRNVGRKKLENVKTNKTRTKNPSPFQELKVDMSSFDKDVAAFELEEQETFNTSQNLDFEELFNKFTETEANEELTEVKEEQPVPPVATVVKETKKDVENYKRAKKALENFQVDNDLANFGLDEELDFSDFDDEDWN